MGSLVEAVQNAERCGVGELYYLVGVLEDMISSIEAENFTLFGQGWVGVEDHLGVPSEWWREEKYLYLVFPMEDGKRVRKYIGADKKAVEAARAGVARQKRWLENKEYLQRLRLVQHEVRSDVSRYVYKLHDLVG